MVIPRKITSFIGITLPHYSDLEVKKMSRKQCKQSRKCQINHIRSSASDLDKGCKKWYIGNNLGWVNQQEEAEVRNKRKRVGNQRDRTADKTAEAGKVTRGFLYAFEEPVFSLEVNILCRATFVF